MCPKNLIITCVLAAILVCCNGAARPAVGGFVGRNGVEFVKDGKPFHFNGFNAYWLMYMGSNPSTSNKVSSVFTQASKIGMNVARTFAFNDGGSNPLQKSPGLYDENMFKGLDFVVSEAKKNGIYLILSMVNNYKDLGGRSQYVEWAKQKGEKVDNEDQFYTNPTIKTFYKNHVKTVLTRVNTITGVAYKDEPAIFSWELMNEPRCNIDTSGKTVQDWVEEMSAYIKSIDKSHLLEIGLEGFYGESKRQLNPNSLLLGTDFISLNRLANVDWATVHLYPDQWLQGSNDSTQLTFARNWVQEHANDAKSILGKPLALAEFGKNSKSSGFTIEARENYYRDMYDAVYNCAKNRGPCSGALFWQLLAEGMDGYGDGYEVVLEKSPSTAAVINTQSRRMSTLA
ncbi:mannan endo-1,4-beta-mannosidase 4-like [Andrographis paniculata]|uniref:mannan endo-1,4-beta-mannosidase 4-like n=1 Tax=Andrographis paniculata TaxID=175694 RepID=UPI0021E83702|nr:mannan endo-1,4-beta-mannosidase 4-like [Andrographis paniculata]